MSCSSSLSFSSDSSFEQDGYEVIKFRGQRIFRPIDPEFMSSAYDDVRNHEIFLHNLPKDVLESELLPFLTRVGGVYQIRFMMNFSGETKSKAFVIFDSVRAAYRAVTELNMQYIRADCPPIRVTFSANNRRLHLTNLPLCLDQKELLSLGLEGITKVKLFNSKSKLTNEAIISFKDHYCAAQARRSFISGSIRLAGKPIMAQWAKPKDFQTLFLLFNKEFEEKYEHHLYDLFEDRFNQIHNIVYKGCSVFIKYQTIQMAQNIHSLYNDLPFPLTIFKDLYLMKVSWPERK